jgi:hypothetical protein
VPVEIVAGFGLLRVFEFAQMFGLAVGKPIGPGTLIALPPFSLLAGRSKIDNVCHSTPRR